MQPYFTVAQISTWAAGPTSLQRYPVISSKGHVDMGTSTCIPNVFQITEEHPAATPKGRAVPK